MTNLSSYIANARKAIIQVLTLVATFGAFALTYESSIPKQYVGVITSVVAFAGVVLHYLTPNAPAPGSGTADDPFNITTLPSDEDDEADRANPDFQPTDLVTADQVAASIPPSLQTTLAPTDPPIPVTPPTT